MRVVFYLTGSMLSLYKGDGIGWLVFRTTMFSFTFLLIGVGIGGTKLELLFSICSGGPKGSKKLKLFLN